MSWLEAEFYRRDARILEAARDVAKRKCFWLLADSLEEKIDELYGMAKAIDEPIPTTPKDELWPVGECGI